MPRRALLVVLVCALVAPGAAARPAALPACTITGTAGDDFLFDTRGNDVLCGLGGNDILAAGLGNDTLVGGPGADSLEGAAGSDVLLGGAGNDVIRAWDGRRDRVDGGAGRDRAWIDPSLDRVKSVERFR